MTAELEREGVRSFRDSYRDLLACIEAKLGRVAAPAPAGCQDGLDA